MALRHLTLALLFVTTGALAKNALWMTPPPSDIDFSLLRYYLDNTSDSFVDWRVNTDVTLAEDLLEDRILQLQTADDVFAPSAPRTLRRGLIEADLTALQAVLGWRNALPSSIPASTRKNFAVPEAKLLASAVKMNRVAHRVVFNTDKVLDSSCVLFANDERVHGRQISFPSGAFAEVKRYCWDGRFAIGRVFASAFESAPHFRWEHWQRFTVKGTKTSSVLWARLTQKGVSALLYPLFRSPQYFVMAVETPLTRTEVLLPRSDVPVEGLMPPVGVSTVGISKF